MAIRFQSHKDKSDKIENDNEGINVVPYHDNLNNTVHLRGIPSKFGFTSIFTVSHFNRFISSGSIRVMIGGN